MQQWIVTYTKSLVSQPDRVSLSVKEGALVDVLHLTVASEDLALLGGKQNRLTRAIGSVIALAGVKRRRRYVLKVQD